MPRFDDSWRSFVPAEARAATPPTSKNKFNARRTRIGSEVFDSKHEAAVWQELRAEQAAGLITGLQRQRPFALLVVAKRDQQPVLVGRYTADFVCMRNGELEVIEAKSRATKTEAYQLRKKLFEALTGLTIQER